MDAKKKAALLTGYLFNVMAYVVAWSKSITSEDELDEAIEKEMYALVKNTSTETGPAYFSELANGLVKITTDNMEEIVDLQYEDEEGKSTGLLVCEAIRTTNPNFEKYTSRVFTSCAEMVDPETFDTKELIKKIAKSCGVDSSVMTFVPTEAYGIEILIDELGEKQKPRMEDEEEEGCVTQAPKKKKKTKKKATLNVDFVPAVASGRIHKAKTEMNGKRGAISDDKTKYMKWLTQWAKDTQTCYWV